MTDFVTLWTAAHQAPLLMEFSGQEHWSGLPFPSPGDLPNPGIKPASPVLAGGFFTTEPPGKPRRALAYSCYYRVITNRTLFTSKRSQH